MGLMTFERRHDPWLDGFRHRCDPLADEACEEIAAHAGGRRVDLLATCEELAPESSACHRLLEFASTAPVWAEPPSYEAGRRMFEHNGVLSLMVGFTVLVESYAGGRDNKVLMMSGRLGSGDAFRRLVETADFTAKVVSPAGFAPGTPGYRALLSVRLLHARVRQHCRRAGYDVQRYDEPVNQEAMAGTLMLFSTGVVRALEKLGVYIGDEERESYHRLWRHAGYLLGVDEALLPATYGEEVALFERIKAHQYCPDEDTRTLFESAVQGVAEGARHLPLSLQVLGAGLMQSEWFLRGLTAACVDPGLAEFLVGPRPLEQRAMLAALRRALGASTRLQRLPVVHRASHAVKARLFHGIVQSLQEGDPARFDNPGFTRAAS